MPSPILISATDESLPRDIPGGLARYTGFRDMARGGGGVLRSAVDQVTGRVVAIKTLDRTQMWDRAHRRRFLREARVTAQLQHPNTVPVYDVGDDDKEGLFFTMKRISGENLFQILVRIARGDAETAAAFPLTRRIDILADACQALAYAHVRGVIHRDVKPENIWVGNFGEVILLDWGAAKVWGHADDNVPLRDAEAQPASPPSSSQGSAMLSDAKSQLRTLTSGGQRPGTPLYMSPEQVSGKRTLDERSDVFSAGVCLYEAMAIREPFRGQDIDETFQNIRTITPDPPSVRNPDAGIPAAMDDIVMRAIAKEPRDRYQHIRQFIADIRAANVS